MFKKKAASFDAASFFSLTGLAAIRIDVGIRVFAGFWPVWRRFETRAEFIVVVGVMVLLIHRCIGAWRVGGLALTLTSRRALTRGLRINRRVIAVNRRPRLFLSLCRFVFHTYLARDGKPTIQTAGALKV
jgi:hypothetical protein